jgi:epoxyqueuosine reductase QueG
LKAVRAEAIERLFQDLCAGAGRCGLLGFAPVAEVRLLPEQVDYLQRKLQPLPGSEAVTAVSIGLLYHDDEVQAIPASWQAQAGPEDEWNAYARAYGELNRLLNRLVLVLADEFGGVAEQATVEGWAGTVGHVAEYFGHCVSHRAFAEAAQLGWRGRHGLIVTPEAGPALRFATVFVPQHIGTRPRQLAGCGECRACVKVCPVLRKPRHYREACRKRLTALNLDDEVCGICVRTCWQQVTHGGVDQEGGLRTL